MVKTYGTLHPGTYKLLNGEGIEDAAEINRGPEYDEALREPGEAGEALIVGADGNLAWGEFMPYDDAFKEPGDPGQALVVALDGNLGWGDFLPDTVILLDASDPGAAGGTAADVGTLALCEDGTAWLKTGAAVTAWSRLRPIITGSATLAATVASIQVTLVTAQPDTDYSVFLTVRRSTLENLHYAVVSNKLVGAFDINLNSAVAADDSVVVDWMVVPA